MTRRQLLTLLAVLAAIAAFVALDLGRFLSLDALRERQQALQALYAARPVLVLAAYVALYVAVTAVSLPGAALLTLAGGAIFGLLAGTLVVSFASSIGATLAFLAARTVLRDAVQRRFGARLAEVDAGIARDGAWYLFALRLVPIVPFFVVNLLMGLTRMRVRTFYAVSQLGMLAGTIVYVNAGRQLARIESVGDVMSPALLGAFALLGVFPLAARKAVDALRRRRVYARWASAKPKRFERNLVVIGAGAAGLVASYVAATLKASVTLVESRRMGGDCLHTGCVPSKALIRAATLARGVREAPSFGLADAHVRVDFAAVMERVAQAIRRIEPHDSAERYAGLGVEVVHGHATLVNPWTVEVAGDGGARRAITTRAIVIAAGAAPIVPPLPGLDPAECLTSETLWSLRELPRRLVVLGGGPVGCELAQAFARLGSSVTQVEMAPRLLMREDPEVSAFARHVLERDGVQVRTGWRAVRVERTGDERALVVQGEGGAQRLAFDRLLCAVGRQARLAGYGLEALGIPAGRTVETDAFLQTLYPNIYACGDVAGPLQFTHAASHQAWCAAANALFGRFWRFRADRSPMPWSTFTDPEVARVGLSEEEAKAQGVPFEVTRYGLDELDRAIADGAAEGFVKVLTVPGRDRILGVAIVAPHAGDLIAEFVLAMKHGLGLNKVLGTIHVYPTWVEANRHAAGAWKRAHAPQRLLRWAGRFLAWQRG